MLFIWVAWIRRFVDVMIRKMDKKGPLYVQEINDAEIAVYRTIQRQSFEPELNLLQQELPILKESPLFHLSPVLPDRVIPLTMSSDDPLDQQPLTPSQLLTLKGSNTLGSRVTDVPNTFRRARWKQTQVMVDQFWTHAS